ncbi:hypothetical protein ES703_66563 [subsurface metagenome]
MPERILIPLDGSKLAEVALPHIEELLAKLAPGLEVEVTLFQVVSPLTHEVPGGDDIARIPYTEEEMEQIKKKAMDYLDKAGEGLRSKGAIVKCKVGVGSAAEEIIKAADEINAGLIAMTTHGRSGLSRWAFGSVTDKVLRGGNRLILTVRVPREAVQT